MGKSRPKGEGPCPSAGDLVNQGKGCEKGQFPEEEEEEVERGLGLSMILYRNSVTPSTKCVHIRRPQTALSQVGQGALCRRHIIHSREAEGGNTTARGSVSAQKWESDLQPGSVLPQASCSALAKRHHVSEPQFLQLETG